MNLNRDNYRSLNESIKNLSNSEQVNESAAGDAVRSSAYGGASFFRRVKNLASDVRDEWKAGLAGEESPLKLRQKAQKDLEAKKKAEAGKKEPPLSVSASEHPDAPDTEEPKIDPSKDPKYKGKRQRRQQRQQRNDPLAFDLKTRLAKQKLLKPDGTLTRKAKDVKNTVQGSQKDAAEKISKDKKENASWKKTEPLKPEETLGHFKKHKLNQGHITQLNRDIKKAAKRKGIDLKDEDYPRLHAHFLNLISGKRSTSGMKMKPTQAFQALFDNKEYYKELRLKLLEMYKK